MTAPFTTSGSTAPREASDPARGRGAAVWRLVIEGRDVSAELDEFVQGVTFTDHEHGESDDVEVRLSDRDGRWAGAWHPQKGDRLALQIGYAGTPTGTIGGVGGADAEGPGLLDCGRFEIDQLELTGPPAMMTLRAQATAIRSPLRTRRRQAYEGQTLRQVAEAVAARHGLRVVGALDAIGGTRVGRLDQRADDLRFLTALAERFGFVFSVRGDALVFYALEALDAAPARFTIGPTDVARYTFKSRATRVYQAAEVSYDDPITGAPITRLVAADGRPSAARADVLKVSDRVESAGQAEVVGRAALRRANGRAVEATLAVPGEPRLLAGVNIDVVGYGVYDGTYHVTTSRHALSRDSGYTTEVEARRVAAGAGAPTGAAIRGGGR